MEYHMVVARDESQANTGARNGGGIGGSTIEAS